MASSRAAQLGKQQILFRYATSRQMASAGRISGTVIQALRWPGRRQINGDTVSVLRRRLTDKDKKQLLRDLRFAPAWTADIMRRVAKPETACPWTDGLRSGQMSSAATARQPMHRSAWILSVLRRTSGSAGFSVKSLVCRREGPT